MMKHGLISQLSPPYYDAALGICPELDQHYGIKLLWQDLMSHFSPQIAEDRNINALISILETFSKEQEPFLSKSHHFLKTFQIPLKCT